ncbi:MAG: hypothetical protein FJX52_01330 [Alphaproteobacteria bacterium]|nr:hypothetical protein [Alphaproteobacteria bacterium]
MTSSALLSAWVRSAHMKDHMTVPVGAISNAVPVFLGTPMGDGCLPVIETTRRLMAAGVDRICFENCWAYQTDFRDRRGDGTIGRGPFGYRQPPYDPTRHLPGLPHKARPGEPDAATWARERGLDLVALEAGAMTRSVAWLQSAFAEAGIALARPLRVPS